MGTKRVQYWDWDDLVFENRNVAYGAYRLRRLYNYHLILSLLITLGVVFYAIVIPKTLQAIDEEAALEEQKKTIIKYSELLPPPSIILSRIEPVKIDMPREAVKIVKFLPPKVTQEEFIEEEMLPDMKTANQNVTGNENREGLMLTEDNYNAPETVDVKEEIIEPIKEENKVYELMFVDQQPEFPGGLAEVTKYLSKHLRYPPRALDMKIEGVVYVMFIVDATGTITNVNIAKGILKECDDEAVRVIRNMPNWKPGKQGGRPVSCKFSLPIRFKMRTI